jgi:hypothetical protein
VAIGDEEAADFGNEEVAGGEAGRHWVSSWRKRQGSNVVSAEDLCLLLLSFALFRSKLLFPAVKG